MLYSFVKFWDEQAFSTCDGQATPADKNFLCYLYVDLINSGFTSGHRH
jgi:hypothetical protein